MADQDIQKTYDDLREAFIAFEREHPELAHAIKVLNIPFQQYLEALAAMKGEPSSSGNATSVSSPSA